MDSAILAKEALKLSAWEKAHLIDTLWESLDAANQGEIDRAWLEESRSRLDAYRRGELKTLDGETVLKEVASALGQ